MGNFSVTCADDPGKNEQYPRPDISCACQGGVVYIGHLAAGEGA
jgi:hypothetical protein